MNRLPQDPTAQQDEAVVMPPAGAVGFLLGLVHLGIGGVAVALAVDDGFAEGKAAFAAGVWRFVLGGVGAVLGLLAVRGLLRVVAAQEKRLTPEVRASARRRGLVVVLVGVWLFATATFEGIAQETVAFDSWVDPFFIAGGIYLTLLGLSLQLDPTGPLRRQRLAQGYGAAGTATILRASDTGVTFGDVPQMKVDFEIEADGRRYEASDNVVMEQSNVALLAPGSTVDVLVDRGDPRVFRVDWNSWRGPERAEEPS
ncbi:MAG: hypothetical protein ABR613_06975 [Actinomycetota bacterium]